MKIVKFIYQENEIDFEINKNLMVNATEMAKCYPNKRINDFIESKDTQDFINECMKYCKNKTENPVLFSDKNDSNNHISDYLNIESKEDLIISKQKSGTWMHRILALKFAAWLSSTFELWVYITIDTLINQYYNQHKEATIKLLTAKQKKEAIKLEILEKYSNLPEISEYFELDKTEKEASKERHLAMMNQVKQLKLEFDFK